MRRIWEIALREKSNGFRVTIKGRGKTIQGEGATPYRAYENAEQQLVVKPAFFLEPPASNSAACAKET